MGQLVLHAAIMGQLLPYIQEETTYRWRRAYGGGMVIIRDMTAPADNYSSANNIQGKRSSQSLKVPRRSKLLV